ncbi:uncharacterized protein LOC111378939 isoform X1 [Olea europaea var. sylvestris]|uniref:uncharacterized protein LOC111378939 isoform X1 n=1 Tax=Olea europaea var. sylvestris TaxID=158386 RepID=UPI000C1D3B7B|nr:uncharacterized protein LOC111378939 isoform X1 [Olea europaea var. sylvestris]XP_022858000.1 uncharacterized protein LOC111378939 isoform X1 [Olea europaea var. sylvestris]
MSSVVDLRRKDGSKKSKLKMKQEHVTKDEEEVAETLYALASMVPDTTKTKKLGLDGETSEAKSSSLLQAKSSEPAPKDVAISTPQGASKKISTRVSVKAAYCPSNLTESTVQVVKIHSSGDATQPNLPFNKESSTTGASGVQLEPSLVPMLKMPTLDATPSGELPITLEQVGIQNAMPHAFTVNKSNDLSLWTGSSPTGALSSLTQGSCLQSSSTKLPAWFDQTNFATPRSCEKSVTDEKLMSQDSQVPIELKKSWKKCCAHVYITRLIKVLQLSERKDGLQEKPAHSSQNERLNLQPRASVDSQTNAINGSNCVASFNYMAHSTSEKNSADIQNAILLYKRLLQDQQRGYTTPGLCTSLKQDSDFLSLAAGGCGVDSSDRINRTGRSHEGSKHFHVPFIQPQNQSAMLLSLHHNGYSSTFPGHASTAAAQQIQLPPYLSSTLGGPPHVDATVPERQQSESDEQQKWMAQIPDQYHPGLITPHLPDWQNGGRDSSSLLNYAQAHFPHFHSSLNPKYKGILQPQQQQIINSNSSVPHSNLRRHYNRLPSGFERNGASFHPESLQQLQLLCNQHL